MYKDHAKKGRSVFSNFRKYEINRELEVVHDLNGGMLLLDTFRKSIRLTM